MASVVVRSRSGNVILAIVGAVYVLAAIVVFVGLISDAWNAATRIDRILQFGVAIAAAGGVWFVLIGLENLGLRTRWRGLPHFPRRSAGAR